MGAHIASKEHYAAEFSITQLRNASRRPRFILEKMQIADRYWMSQTAESCEIRLPNPAFYVSLHSMTGYAHQKHVLFQTSNACSAVDRGRLSYK